MASGGAGEERSSVPGASSNKAGSKWRVDVLGGCRVVATDGTALSVPGKRERVLLAYLLLIPNHRQNRRKLTTFLWGDAADETTLDNLRTCVWGLRKALNDSEHQAIQSDGEWIAIDEDAFDVDALRFRLLTSAESIPELEQAVALYTGDLLDGIEINSSEFEEWLRDERARHRELAVEALERLSTLYADSGETDKALEAGQAVLRIDPYNERAIRGLMQLYADSGRRHMAVQLCKSHDELIRAELGVDLESETKNLLERLSHGPEVAAESELANAGHTELEPSSSGGSDAADKDAVPPIPQTSEDQSQPSRGTTRSWLRAFLVGVGGALFGSAIVLLIVVGAIYWRIPELAPAPFGFLVSGVKQEIVGEAPSVAVLTFRSHGDADAGDFAHALSNAISDALSITTDIMVVSRSSVLAYESHPLRPQLLARELGVRYLLEGTITKFGDNVSVQIGLLDTAQGEQYVPLGNFDRRTTDFFSLQRDITLDVITTMEIHLTEGEQERISAANSTSDFDAWLEASRGETQLRKMTPKSVQLARESYQKAVQSDPNYAGAWTGLAWTYVVEARFGWANNRAAVIRQAAELAKRAYGLDPDRAAIHSLLGVVHLMMGQIEDAEEAGERAVEMESNDADAAALLALTLTYAGEPNRAISLARRAIRLRPYPPRWYRWVLARGYRLAGDYEEAISILTSEDIESQGVLMPLVELAAVYSESGKVQESRNAAEMILRVQPTFSARAWILAPAHRDPEQQERELVILLEAGLPE